MRARFFGQYLIANGLVTSPQLLAAVEYQERNNNKVGDCAVTLGLATPFEVEQVRALQARQDLRFGDAALRLGVLSDDEVQRAVAARESAHVQLGEALVALGYLSAQQVEAAAATFIAAEARLEPEVVTLPDDLAYRDVAFELFHLAHKLLLRVCDLTSKTERVRVIRDVLPLSDRNARIAFSGAAPALHGGASLSGAIDSAVLLCVPHAIATDMAARFSGEVAPDEAAVDSIVSELVKLLCGNLQSVLAEQGVRITLGEPERIPARVSMPPGSSVALVPFVTHRGQVLVGLGLPHAG